MCFKVIHSWFKGSSKLPNALIFITLYMLTDSESVETFILLAF